MPLHCTAAGTALLAYLPPEQQEAIFFVPLTKYTEKTITNLVQLKSELTDVCRQGYAIAHEEFEEEYSAVAAPVFTHSGKVAGVISLSGPTYRLGPGQIENFIEPLLETAHKASADMGYR
jgi:DNA-binding IclR family transcriptional regulator